MRVLVCGDRNWNDKVLIYWHLGQLSKETVSMTVIEGCARGADTIGGEWADEFEIEHLKFPADWNKYGRAAGHIRNKQMLVEGKPDLVLAFHDDIANSKGTGNMVKIAKAAGIETRVISHANH